MEKNAPYLCLNYKSPFLKTQYIYSDAELLEQAKKGNASAFRQLVERHEQQVRSTVIGMLGDTVEADDVAQEVFIRFYKSMDRFRGDAQLGTYLSRIAINLSLNELKRRQRQNKWLTYFQKDDNSLQVEDQSARPERQETKELVHQAIQRLEPEFRAVVVLRLIDGYSVKETAEILNVPKGTIASRLARAQKKLKGILSEWA